MHPLSSLFSSGQDYTSKLYGNVSFTYKRLGTGDTISLWRFDQKYYYEDHKAGRPSFAEQYSCFLPKMINILDSDPEISVDKALFHYHSDDNPGHTLSNVLKSLAVAQSLDVDVYAFAPVRMLALGDAITFAMNQMKRAKLVLPVLPDTHIHTKQAFMYAGSWYFQYRLNCELGPLLKRENPLVIRNIDSLQMTVSPEAALFKKICESSLLPDSADQLPKKICIMKSQGSATSSGLSRGFASDYFGIFRQYGFEIVSPETHSLSDIYTMLSSASQIVTSWGAVSFINKLFFSPSADILWLCHEGYSQEYRSSWWQLLNCYACPSRSSTYLFDAHTTIGSVERSAIEQWLKCRSPTVNPAQ
jgi:hypothetical protein